jgi:hypothetical protein
MLMLLTATTLSQGSMAAQLKQTSSKLVLLRAADIGVLFARMSMDLAPRSMAAECGCVLSQALLASRRLQEALQAAVEVGSLSAVNSLSGDVMC